METTLEPTWTSACGLVRLWQADWCDITLPACDALLTDPPYGILKNKQHGSGKLKHRVLNNSDIRWDDAPPTKDEFERLRAVTGSQIIWGGNYFDLPPYRAVLVWDKMQPWQNFSQVEIAWTSLDCPAGMYRIKSVANKKHPTQKPVSLMSWCLDYLKGVKSVLDPYMGSGTTAVACIRRGISFVGVERDAEYFALAKQRIENELRQYHGGFNKLLGPSIE